MPPRRGLFLRAGRAAAPRAFSECRTCRRAARFSRAGRAAAPRAFAPPPPRPNGVSRPPNPRSVSPPPPLQRSVSPPPPPPHRRAARFSRAGRAYAPRAFSESRTRRRAARFFREPDAPPRRALFQRAGRHRVAVLIWRADDGSCVRVYLGHGFFLGIFVNWYWGKIFVAGESQKHPEELLSNETKVLLVLLENEKPENENSPVPVFHKTGTLPFSFFTKMGILVFHKARILPFSFFTKLEFKGFSFSAKRKFSDSRFPQNRNSRIFVFHKTGILRFPFSTKREFLDCCFPRNDNSRILIFRKKKILGFHKFRDSPFPQNENSRSLVFR